MTFATGQRVLIPAKVHSPGSDRVWVNLGVENIHETDDEKIMVLVDAGDVQAAPPLPSRFRAGQVYKNSCDQNRYLITGVEDDRVNFSDSNGEQGWFMLGSFIDEALQLVLDVEER